MFLLDTSCKISIFAGSESPRITSGKGEKRFFMRWIFFWCLLAVFCLGGTVGLYAQDAEERSVRGKVYDAEQLDPMPGATVQAYDSAGIYVSGAATDARGAFRLRKLQPGKYQFKISFMGYKPQTVQVDLTGDRTTVRLKDILLREAVYQMGETRVTARGSEMVMRQDTLVYRAEYYRTPAGARLSDLIRRMPGISAENGQNLQVNGKRVSRILINGKEFFGDDPSMALKYLPAELVRELKVYDKKSDEADWTGVDDGSRETVIDLTVADDFQNSWTGDAEAAYGTSNRYSGRASLNYFREQQYFSLIGQADNSSSLGDANNQNVGLSFNNSWKKFSLNGNVSYYRNEMNQNLASSVQSFENTTAAFSESRNRMYNRSQSANASFTLKWRPDSMTVVSVSPSFNWSGGRSSQESLSASFASDPYLQTGIDSPLDRLDLLADSVALNANRSVGDGNNGLTSFQMNLNVARRFRKKGRSLMVGLNAQRGESRNEQNEFRQIDYYRLMTVSGADSVYHRVQFDRNPGTNTSLGGRLTYSEPLGNDYTLLFTYQVSARRQDDRREVSSLLDPWVEQLGANRFNFRDFQQEAHPDTLQCRTTQNRVLQQQGEVGINLQRTKFQLNAGVLLHSEWTRFSYRAPGREADVDNLTLNWAPKLNFYYNVTSTESWNVSYLAMTQPVSAQQLIPDTLDYSDPLNLQLGNPDLKPSFTHMLNVGYNRFVPETMRSYNLYLYYSLIRNSVSMQSMYDEWTGRRTMIPVNVNGNMNGSLNYQMNIPLKNQKFSFTLLSNANYMRYVGFTVNSGSTESLRTVTNQLGISPNLRVNYRDDLFDCSLSLGGSYELSRNTSVSAGNMDTYGMETRFYGMVQMPWSMELSTDFTFTARWGYSFENVENKEWIWNLQLSYGFLKGRKAKVGLRGYDLLNGRNSLSRSFSSSMRTDIHYDSFGRYALLYFSYNFSLFGKDRKK